MLQDLQNNFEKLFSKFNFELDILGLKIGKRPSEGGLTINEFVNFFCNNIAKCYSDVEKNKKDGIILFIDELDSLKVESGVATFLKLCAEKLNRDGYKKVAFFCAGITGAVQQLENDHASVHRTFRDILIPRLNDEETKSILRKGFSSCGYKCDNAVLFRAHEISAGFPEPIHLIGSEILSLLDADEKIEMKHLNQAMIKVISDVKKNKLHTILEKSGKGKYQLILRAMASYPNEVVPLNYISENIKYNQNEYSTNMGNLITRGIISKTSKGEYAFIDPLLKEYIRHFGVLSNSASEEG